MNKTLKNIIITVVALVIIWVIYSYFFKEDKAVVPAPSSSALQSTTGAPVSSATPINISSSEIAQDTAFLSTLLSLGKITIDASLLRSVAFMSLRDNTQFLPQDVPVGRENPFAPFDRAPSDTSTTIPPLSPTIVPTN